MRLVFVQRQACCKNREKGLGGREGNGLSIWLTEDFCGFLQTRPVHFLKLCKFVILHLQTWHINERSTAQWDLEIWTSGRQLLRSCSLWLSLEEPFQGSWIEVVDVLRKTQNWETNKSVKKTILIRIHLLTHSETGTKRRNTQQLLSNETVPNRPKTLLTKANADRRNVLRRKMAITEVALFISMDGKICATSDWNANYNVHSTFWHSCPF